MIPALFLSDSHEFTESAAGKRIIGSVLRWEPRHLYIVGDLLDLWVSPDARLGRKGTRSLIFFLLDRARRGMKITYCIGNHDGALDLLKGLDLGGIEIVREAVHTAADGGEYLACHGDRFDKWMKYRTLGVFAARLYNWVRRRRWSLAEHLMAAADSAAGGDLDAFEKAACRYAEKRFCSGIICGHTHVADASEHGGIEYWNCGTAAGNCIIEREDGSLEIVGSG